MWFGGIEKHDTPGFYHKEQACIALPLSLQYTLIHRNPGEDSLKDGFGFFFQGQLISLKILMFQKM